MTTKPQSTGVTHQPLALVVAGNNAEPTPGKIDLRDGHAIRRELASVYRDMRRGVIETQAGTRLAYVLDLIRKSYETSVLQERLETLERTYGKRKRAT